MKEIRIFANRLKADKRTDNKYLRYKTMALQCGIVGLPNVGKSTLFNCLSNAKAQAANFPFCTIEPNVGVITVPDERLTKLAELVLSLIHI